MSDDVERAPWDQLPDEPITAYRRFLIYRDLGPGRSLERGYQAVKGSKKQVSGMWLKESSLYHWKDRATAWDIANMADQGAATVINWIKTMEILSSKAIKDALKPDREIRSLDQLLDVLNVIGSFITPEVIQAARELAGGNIGRADDPQD